MKRNLCQNITDNQKEQAFKMRKNHQKSPKITKNHKYILLQEKYSPHLHKLKAMLIKYAVENFRSFKGMTEFSLMADRGTLKKEHKLPSIKGVSTLKIATIFGANASGKSNLVKAIAFGKHILLEDIQGENINYEPYMLEGDSIQHNSKMRYDIQVNGKIYSYGFEFNRNMIVEESLVEMTSKRTKHGIFMFRRDSENGEVKFEFDYLKRKNKSEDARQFILFIAKATPKNHLFLHEVSSRNMERNVQNIEDLNAVINWFANTLQIIMPNQTYKMGFTLKAAGSEELRNAYSELLHYFDTGIKTINLVDVEFDKLMLPTDLANKIRVDLLDRPKTQMGILTFRGNSFLLSGRDGIICAQKLMTVHTAENNCDIAFDLSDESDGTIRLLDYIPLIMDLMMGNKVFFVDEMERSLHPNLIQALIELYITLSQGVNSQLVLTTHESTLMSQALLRKDEIWFVVKEKGESFLTALEEYRVRFDKDIRSEYLKGTYRGVPVIGDKRSIYKFLESRYKN